MKIQCLIIEDEPLAVDVMKDFVGQVPFLDLCGVCKDALSAMEFMRKQPVDLLFLDLHLPRLKGLDFLAALNNPPLVIITTAYEAYALKSYEYQVLDYLLKPVEFGRFMAAVNKALDRMQVPPIVPEETTDLYVNVAKKRARLALDSILYVESQRDNIRIVTDSGMLIAKCSITEIEKKLPHTRFLRVHRSFIVAKNKIDFVAAQDVEIGGQEIPIGRNYRDAVLRALGLS